MTASRQKMNSTADSVLSLFFIYLSCSFVISLDNDDTNNNPSNQIVSEMISFLCDLLKILCINMRFFLAVLLKIEFSPWAIQFVEA